LQVSEADAPAATELLARLQLDPSEVEPEHDADPDAPVADPTGPGMLTPAAAYDNPRYLFDAAASLGASHIESFLPSLVPRGDRPPGSGNRFVIRVREADLERARAILQGQDEPQEKAEPRCPRCGSWRVYLHPPKQGLVNFLLGRIPEQPQRLECLRCHHTWETEQRRRE
jgi:DNA-directed RNA polymerase subunit RPC12/RpoP